VNDVETIVHFEQMPKETIIPETDECRTAVFGCAKKKRKKVD